MSSDAPVVFWFRRDLRLGDHRALRAAIDEAGSIGGTVLPLFVLDPKLLGPSGGRRRQFLNDALLSLQDHGVPLLVCAGNPARVLAEVAGEYGASSVFATEDFGPYGRQRDTAVQASLQKSGVGLQLVDSPYVCPPGTILKGDGTSYRVFTPFSKVWREHASSQPCATIDPLKVPWAPTNASENATGLLDVARHTNRGFVASERAAHQQLRQFLPQLATYDEQRNNPSVQATSSLSPYLKFGLLHPRQVLAAARSAEGSGSRGHHVFESEICWRDFYADVLFREPGSARNNLQIAMNAIEMDRGPDADSRFDAWCNGTTGYPFVDAGMRQLQSEGWMHNRLRMVVASFLVKDLHLEWQRGARWFMQHLVDGDLASNQHGWQWTAGTGTDASPYFRVFNPVEQGKKFDPKGAYIRKWVPELSGRNGNDVHEPWLAEGQAQLNSDPDDGIAFYPDRIVDHRDEREETLRRYRVLRESASGR